jgi:hypothetical protein
MLNLSKTTALVESHRWPLFSKPTLICPSAIDFLSSATQSRSVVCDKCLRLLFAVVIHYRNNAYIPYCHSTFLRHFPLINVDYHEILYPCSRMILEKLAYCEWRRTTGAYGWLPPPSVSRLWDVGASASPNYVGLHGLLQGKPYFFFTYRKTWKEKEWKQKMGSAIY